MSSIGASLAHHFTDHALVMPTSAAARFNDQPEHTNDTNRARVSYDDSNTTIKQLLHQKVASTG
ncbi:MAG: hypothetical protein R2687_06905 [Candidatus Nanopelagicales bacterium]